MRIIHFFNPVLNPRNTKLLFDQKTTFESFDKAKKFKDNNIKLITLAILNKGEQLDNQEFDIVEHLDRDILDIVDFEKRKKLPLINDLLQVALRHAQPEDYLIYTNIDIVLMPHFYDFVYEQVLNRHLGLIINRRTIEDYEDKSLTELYSSIGKEHVGYDCFIFKAIDAQKFHIRETCLGASWAGKAFYINMKVFCSSLKIYKNEHLTFHLGDDKNWENQSFHEYKEHNGNNIISAIQSLLESVEVSQSTKVELLRLSKRISNELQMKSRKSFFGI